MIKVKLLKEYFQDKISLSTQTAKLVISIFRSSKIISLFMSKYFLLCGSIIILIYFWYLYQKPHITVTLIDFKEGLFEHPADIIEFNEHFWVTELLSSKVVQVDFGFSSISQSLIHPNPKKSFRSPHNLTVDENSLFFSGGWGSSIYSYDQSLTKFKEIPEKKNQNNIKLNAPHGICRQDNWLYIADSLNSRLIRFDVDNPNKIEIFADKKRRIAYGRQIICSESGIWISNSYEKKEGLNPGNGANIIKINDFSSGKSEIITIFPNTNITGIYIHDNRFLITAKWHANSISIYDIKRNKELDSIELPSLYAGVPYSMFFSTTTEKLYITFIGDLYGKKNKGGIAIYKIKEHPFADIL